MLLVAGYICNARVAASVKKLIKPNFTPCFSTNSFLYLLRKSKIGFMSTSLKVVNMAVSFFTVTKRLASLRRRLLIFLLVEPRSPLPAEPIEATASITSALVIRPSLPVPLLTLAPVSAIIFFAAGLAVPVAYVSACGAAGAAFSATGSGLGAAAGAAAPSGRAAAVSMIQTT